VLFNSHIFLFFFLPVALAGYWTLNGMRFLRAGMFWLLACSAVFYAWWSWSYLLLLIFSIFINFSISKLIEKYNADQTSGAAPKLTLVFGIIFNLLLLSYFKYFNFLMESGAWVLGQEFKGKEFILPLAISFYSIQQIVYLIDTYQGLCKGISLLKYSVYITFFPHLIAGPLVLYNELIPQLGRIRSKIFDGSLATAGLMLLSVGLLKKVLIADTLSTWVVAGFDGVDKLTFVEAWTSSLCYALQLYFDFSGYSDMAIGIALLFNLKLPTNFRSPYKSRNIIIFWQNWHITLSRVITNYLYVSILRLRTKLDFRFSMYATFIAMLIAGLWHGADWRFVIFGGMHGTALVVNHVWKRMKLKMPLPIAWALTFLWVDLALVFFRARNWDSVERMLSAMLTPESFGFADLQALSFMIMCFGLIFFAPNSENIKERVLKRPSLKWAIVSGVALAFGLGALEFGNATEFLYFKF
jgi:D-alanyl-lipoteichoic acid acyltransferase DltB (MBOAT superfamily)